MNILNEMQIKQIYGIGRELGVVDNIDPKIKAVFLKAMLGRKDLNRTEIRAKSTGIAPDSVRRCCELFKSNGMITVTSKINNAECYTLVKEFEAKEIIKEFGPGKKLSGMATAKKEITRILSENGDATRKHLIATINVKFSAVDAALRSFLNAGIVTREKEGSCSRYKLTA